MKSNNPTPDAHDALLRKIPPEYWGDMAPYILETARRAGTRVTIYEGLVTSTLHIVLHDGRKPRRKLLARFAAEELAAIPAEGGMQ